MFFWDEGSEGEEEIGRIIGEVGVVSFKGFRDILESKVCVWIDLCDILKKN